MGASTDIVKCVLRALPLAAAVFSGTVFAGADLWHHKALTPDLLQVDQAFALGSAERKAGGIEVTWAIAPGYYLYRKRLGFDVVTPADPSLIGAPVLPKGAPIHDELEGDDEIYRDALVATLPLTAGTAAPRRLRVRYQGCAEIGVCYPPVSRVIDVVQSPE